MFPGPEQAISCAINVNSIVEMSLCGGEGIVIRFPNYCLGGGEGGEGGGGDGLTQCMHGNDICTLD